MDTPRRNSGNRRVLERSMPALAGTGHTIPVSKYRLGRYRPSRTRDSRSPSQARQCHSGQTRMALPSFFLDCKRTIQTLGKRFQSIFPEFTLAPIPRELYHVFGPLWPIISCPLWLGCPIKSQGGLYNVYITSIPIGTQAFF